jgi:hypothetical protein
MKQGRLARRPRLPPVNLPGSPRGAWPAIVSLPEPASLAARRTSQVHGSIVPAIGSDGKPKHAFWTSETRYVASSCLVATLVSIMWTHRPQACNFRAQGARQ